MMIRIISLALNIFFIYSTSISKLNIPQQWEQHKLTHGLSFTPDEDLRRQNIFKANYDHIENHNSKNDKFKLEMNKFGHLETGEIANCVLPKKTENPHQKHKPSASTIPVRDSINWVDYDMVTPVENQGGCGSCYSFSADQVGAIESHFAIHTRELVGLSEQEIVDCSQQYGNMGCRGGYMDDVFQYAINKGVSVKKDYPYGAKVGKCHPRNVNHTHKILHYFDIERGNEAELVSTLSFIGPVSIALDAHHREFTYYKSGIIEIADCNAAAINHAVLAVGYVLGESPYLIAKNRQKLFEF
ncbi:hypothetical protein HZS_2790 [Henneguya salminicola]|nr:hypothetical protein HZS_2790 [Henneguya salminicola]